MPNAGGDALELMEWMLLYNPKKRPLADQVLRHPFFTNYLSSNEIQRAFDVLSGKRPKTEG